MRNKIVLLITVFALFVGNVKSQSHHSVENFLNKIANTINTYDTSATIAKYKISVSKRKTIIVGLMDSGKKSFKKTIKYYKSGLKKEKLKIVFYTSIKKYTILKTVKINGKFSYIEFNEFGRSEEYDITSTYKEIYINNSYEKIYYNENGSVLMKEFDVKTNE